MSVSAAITGGDARVHGARTAVRAESYGSRIAWAGVCALLFVAPFEALRPLLQLPGQAVSTTEAALLTVFAAWIAAHVALRAVPEWRTPLTLPWLALLAVMLTAAVIAPAHQANAVHMVGRLGLAFGVFLLAVNGVTTAGRLEGVLVAAALSGVLVSTLVVLEYTGIDVVLRALRPFRTGVAHVGAQVRASGPFQYPTIASMYLEIIFALALGLLPALMDRGRRWLTAALMVALALIAEAITLTFTRAGLLTLASSLVVVGGLRYRQRGFDRGVKAIAALAVLVAVQFLASRSLEAVRLRLTTEGQAAWYSADVDAPLRFTMSTGSRITVPVTVTNTGRTTWDSAAAQPFLLSYHWLTADQNLVVSWEGDRTIFPAAVQPGESVSLRASVQAPVEPGEYRLLWDIEQRHRLWFSTEPDARLFISRATVSGPVVGFLGRGPLLPLPQARARPGRVVLWRAAGRMLADRPLLGVGPDNFRLLYGEYAGLTNADPRVHSNNTYIELLVAGGFAGGLVLTWLLWRTRRVAAGARRAVATPTAMLSAGVAAAVVAIALHGLVDSFLSFTATYTLMAIVLGLTVACDRLGATHADRV